VKPTNSFLPRLLLLVLALIVTFTLAAPYALAQADPPIPSGSVRIHYYRPDNNFSGWTMWTWNASTENQTAWCSTELNQSGSDSYGVYWDVTVNTSWGNPTGDLGFIIHNCAQNVKDPGPDQHLQTQTFNEAWIISGDSTVYTAQPTAQQLLNGMFQSQQAYWLDRQHLLVKPGFLQSGWTYYLNASPNGGLQLSNSGVTGGTSVKLVPGATLSADELTRYPQLASYGILQLPSTVPLSTIQQFLTGQVALSAVDANNSLKYATGLQIAGVLDDLYYYPGKLGVVINHRDGRDDEAGSAPVQIKLWAPTAKSVSLQIFDNAADTTPSSIVPMQEKNGVWSAKGDTAWIGKYYLYSVQVYVPADHAVDTNLTTDPYSIDISVNGTKSRITDLDSSTTKPAGWDESESPELRSVGDLSIYELHVRDFSINDATVPLQDRGMYDAFKDEHSNGMQHLRALARSGLKAVHIMPSFHFASVNEDKSTWQTTGDLSQEPPDSTLQQQAVANIQGQDGYNWGYDPVHYMTPEGSYAINPDERVLEYRTMVEGLHDAGLRVIQDMVFNHTSAFGESANSNLDEVVPGYYHRLDANGTIETGSCCADTATEHRMMEKLMIDTLVLNAREYKIDGFRFDIMSFHFLYNMQHIQQALSALTPERDGVDGSKIYLYGEGFNFGDTANNQIGPNASQVNLYGYGIGSFNDRIRDGIRGGSPFQDERVQGFATGLFTDPSTFTSSNTSTSDQKTQLLHESDWIRVGLTGNLRDYTLTDSTGSRVTGSQVDYYGQPTGYTKTPVEAINYCSVHDNQDLFDAVQLKSSYTDNIAMRARRQVLAMSLIELGQGVPFFQGGDDMLRSKDMDQNSYDSGDWFNKIDWTGQGANWGIGLPIASQNGGQLSIMQPLLSNAAYAPQPANIQSTTAAFQEFMRIRYSSGLFRMSNLTDIQQNLAFLNTGQNQIPGLIVMKLDDYVGNYNGFNHVLVVFNATTSAITFGDASLKGLHLQLHPEQRRSSDWVVRQAIFNEQQGSATVPAMTTAVFVR
jgi:pullulanase